MWERIVDLPALLHIINVCTFVQNVYNHSAFELCAVASGEQWKKEKKELVEQIARWIKIRSAFGLHPDFAYGRLNFHHSVE